MIADSSVFNIWVGLNDVSLQDARNDICGREFVKYQRSANTLRKRNEIYRAKIRELFKERGLLNTIVLQLKKQYFRLFDHETFFTTQLPGGMRHAYRFNNKLLGRVLSFYSHLFWALLLASFSLGVCFMKYRPIGWVHLLSLLFAYNIVLFFILHVKTRYTLQFLPTLILFSSVGIFWLWYSLRRATVPAIQYFIFTKYRLFFGIVFSFVLQWLAFRSVIFGG